MKKIKNMEKNFDNNENITKYIDLQNTKQADLKKNLNSKWSDEIKSLSGS